jgi:biotin carboxylase
VSRERPHLLLIGGKDSSMRPISDLPIDVTLIQRRAAATALQIERSRNLILLADLDPRAAVGAAAAIHAVEPFDGVLSFFEDCLAMASEIGALLGIAHNPLPAVTATRDKIATRRLLASAGLPSVRFAECTAAAQLRDFLRQAGGPVIVKPSSGSGSRGVALVSDAGDVNAAWEWCQAGGSPPAIAEELVTGRELSVETLSLDGGHQVISVTEKLTSGPPSFIETGHQLPARLEQAQAGAVSEVVLRLLEAVGHRWGPAHTEVMLTPAGVPVLIETQTRFGGDQIWEMVELVTGVRLAAATVAGLFGLDQDGRVPAGAGGAAIRFFAYQDAVVEAVDGVRAARAAPGVRRVEIRAAPGTKLGPLRSSWDRQGYVLATGADTDEAVRRAERAAGLIRFTLTSTA